MTGVKKNFLKLTLDKSHFITESYKFTMKVGESKNLYAKVSNGYRPKYSSSNSKVIAVTKSGQVAAIKKGKATITVSEGGTKVKCQISVEDR